MVMLTNLLASHHSDTQMFKKAKLLLP